MFRVPIAFSVPLIVDAYLQTVREWPKLHRVLTTEWRSILCITVAVGNSNKIFLPPSRLQQQNHTLHCPFHCRYFHHTVTNIFGGSKASPHAIYPHHCVQWRSPSSRKNIAQDTNDVFIPHTADLNAWLRLRGELSAISYSNFYLDQIDIHRCIFQLSTSAIQSSTTELKWYLAFLKRLNLSSDISNYRESHAWRSLENKQHRSISNTNGGIIIMRTPCHSYIQVLCELEFTHWNICG